MEAVPVFEVCPHDYTCLGGDPVTGALSVCEGGSDGVVCSGCEPGTAFVEGLGCTNCLTVWEEMVQLSIVAALVAVVAVVGSLLRVVLTPVLWTLKTVSKYVQSVFIIVNAYAPVLYVPQIGVGFNVGMLAVFFSVEFWVGLWKLIPILGDVDLTALNSILTFQFDKLVSLRCMAAEFGITTNELYYANLLLNIVMMLSLWGGCLVAVLTVKCIALVGRANVRLVLRMNILMRLIWDGCWKVLPFVQTPVCFNLFQHFWCRKVLSDGNFYLRTNYDLQCFTASWFVGAALAGTAIFFYVFVYGAALFHFVAAQLKASAAQDAELEGSEESESESEKKALSVLSSLRKRVNDAIIHVYSSVGLWEGAREVFSDFQADRIDFAVETFVAQVLMQNIIPTLWYVFLGIFAGAVREQSPLVFVLALLGAIWELQSFSAANPFEEKSKHVIYITLRWHAVIIFLCFLVSGLMTDNSEETNLVMVLLFVVTVSAALLVLLIGVIEIVIFFKEWREDVFDRQEDIEEQKREKWYAKLREDESQVVLNLSPDSFSKGKEVLEEHAAGFVTRGKLKKIDVAVKSYDYLTVGTDDRSGEEIMVGVFMQLQKLRHENIVLFCGSSVRGAVALAAFEYLPLGTLREYLSGMKGEIVPAKRITRTLQQVATALEYVHQQGFAFVYLSSHAVYVESELQIKLGHLDYCVAVPGVPGEEGRRGGLAAPTEGRGCVSPEVMLRSEYSVESDSYSFGMLVWELYSCEEPFEFASEEMMQTVWSGGVKPEIPWNTPGVFAEMMEECWDVDPSMRPSMASIVERLMVLESQQECENGDGDVVTVSDDSTGVDGSNCDSKQPRDITLPFMIPEAKLPASPDTGDTAANGNIDVETDIEAYMNDLELDPHHGVPPEE